MKTLVVSDCPTVYLGGFLSSGLGVEPLRRRTTDLFVVNVFGFDSLV
jgi:hypothetical protein